MDNMFEQLMRLPLFQGVSHEQLQGLVEKIPFHFLKFADGQPIIKVGDPCTHLRFVVSGSVTVVTPSQALRVVVNQRLDAPNVIGADYLFGRYTAYPFDVHACGTCGILQLLKADYVNILRSNNVFLFNALNYLSRNAQKATLPLLVQSQGLIGERLARLIVSLTSALSRNIVIDFRQKDLCLLLGARRTSLMRALSEMREQGLIDYNLSQIKVIDRAGLLKFYRISKKP